MSRNDNMPIKLDANDPKIFIHFKKDIHNKIVLTNLVFKKV